MVPDQHKHFCATRQTLAICIVKACLLRKLLFEIEKSESVPNHPRFNQLSDSHLHCILRQALFLSKLDQCEKRGEDVSHLF